MWGSSQGLGCTHTAGLVGGKAPPARVGEVISFLYSPFTKLNAYYATGKAHTSLGFTASAGLVYSTMQVLSLSYTYT